MCASWKGWQLRHVRWIWVSAYLAGAIVALVLGAGAASVLIGVAVALAVVLPLEGWTRFRDDVAAARGISRRASPRKR